MAIKRLQQSEHFSVRVSSRFKKSVERAAEKGGYPSLGEFIKVAVVELAKKHGIEIDRYK